jgi:lauroyl/myristoyl acyltransferase
MALREATVARPGRDERTDALLPGLRSPAERLIRRLPRSLQLAACLRAVQAMPLPRDVEEQLVQEVARCWDGVPLPRPLPDLVDRARALELLQRAEAADAALAGPERAGEFLQITSLLPLEQALGEGRGVLLITPTYGAWQQIAPAVARRGYRVGLLDLRPPARRPERSFPAAPGLDLRTLPSDGYARPLVRFATEAPNVIVALGDAACGPRRAHSSLFGRPVEIASTPFELARRAGLALLPVFAVRQNDGHRLVVEPALRISDTGRGDGDLDVTAGRWLKIVERWARRHPDHYLGHLLLHRLRGGGAFFSDAA